MNIPKEVEQLKDDIDSLFGCDSMYFGVDSLYIANELIKIGYKKQANEPKNDFIMKRFMRCE